MKIAVITCYGQPDYVRARVLRSALKQLPGVETIIVKNSKKGLGRYFEVIRKIIIVKRQEKPDVFLLTFRGYEILPFLLLVAGKTPVIFDEFINLTEWVVDEHKKLSKNSWAAKLLNSWYGRQLKKCRLILADTPAHAQYSSQRSNVPLEKYLALPVGTDETVFQPIIAKKFPGRNSHTSDMTYGKSGDGGEKRSTIFQVLYYGSMLPLHGLDVVLQAALSLLSDKGVVFLLVGGGPKAAEKIGAAKSKGANVEYKKWIPFDELPEAIKQSALCLAGPFGDTLQAQMVVTGKAYQFLACGRPTVVGQNRASNDFSDKQNALVVPQGDAAALAATISWAAAHPSELMKIGANGRQLFEQKFATKIIAGRLGRALGNL
ncbi:MAG TPA: glycosyltransferase [Candidatus Saccharimonadales bacterium]|nr:glycosyltransferase [Candidatus Saccharimonadales bacterium]